MNRYHIFGTIVLATILTAFLVTYSKKPEAAPASILPAITWSTIPNNAFGDEVRYGRELMLRTAYYIGPYGIKGQYLGNKMNCTNCHQDGGTKPFSFPLMLSHDKYPQYRPREGKVLTLADRVNNCIERPHNGKPLPLDSREMTAFLSYLKWINELVAKNSQLQGAKNLEISFPDHAASPARGSKLYVDNCQRCHGEKGEGLLNSADGNYVYPPLWGNNAYQSGSSMHRIIKQAQWLKANMPFDKSTWQNPLLSDEDVLDLAAFINDDSLHKRPASTGNDYPHAAEKAIDYAIAPFIDTFSIEQHKTGPFKPIIAYWNKAGKKPTY